MLQRILDEARELGNLCNRVRLIENQLQCPILPLNLVVPNLAKNTRKLRNKVFLDAGEIEAERPYRDLH